MMGISSKGAFPPIASDQPLDSGRNCTGKNCKTTRDTRINLAKAKVLPQQAPLMYFLAVAPRRCDMQRPPEKLSGEPLSFASLGTRGSSIQHG